MDNLWSELNNDSFISRLESGGFLGPGRYIDIDDKKVHKIPAIDPNVPWIYTNPDPKRYCMEYQAMEKCFNFIPKHCYACWKVVAGPRSFHELMCVYELQKEMVKENERCWCKCGVEEREFVPRNYGAYWYLPSLEVGRERFKTVRKLVSEKISPDVSVVLKRGCTEFELKHGRSDKYKYLPEHAAIEKKFWENIHLQSGAVRQPKSVRDHVKLRWMLFAWGRGDKTVMAYNKGLPLYQPSLTY